MTDTDDLGDLRKRLPREEDAATVARCALAGYSLCTAMRKPIPARDHDDAFAASPSAQRTAMSRRALLGAGCTGVACLPWLLGEGHAHGASALASRSGTARLRSLAGHVLDAPPNVEDLFDPVDPDDPPRMTFDRADLGGRRGRKGPSIELDLPQLKYAGSWNPRPGAMRQLGTELRLRTRLEPRHTPSVVSLQLPELFSTPFLYVAGQGAFPTPNENALALLQRFVGLGGMLVFDDASGGTERSFRSDVAALVPKLISGRELAPVPHEHVLYRSFYLIDAPVGRTAARDHDLGVIDEGRLKILFLTNDLGGALARDESGRYRWSCLPGGEEQREWAIRLGINVLLYATCTDYKSDPAHVETLLRSRRWR